MNKTKNEVKEKKTYDVEACIKSAANLMSTQMQDAQCFNLFVERAVSAMIQELKQLEEGPMPGKKG